jgi:hypothetical protein
MKTPAKAIKKVAEKQKASASEKKNKSLIKVGGRIDPQFRGQFKGLVDAMTKEYKQFGFTRSQAAREIVKELRIETMIKEGS